MLAKFIDINLKLEEIIYITNILIFVFNTFNKILFINKIYLLSNEQNFGYDISFLRFSFHKFDIYIFIIISILVLVN